VFFPAGMIAVPIALQPAEGKKFCSVVIVPISSATTLVDITPQGLKLVLRPLQEFIEKSKDVVPYKKLFSQFQAYVEEARISTSTLDTESKEPKSTEPAVEAVDAGAAGEVASEGAEVTATLDAGVEGAS
jgi:hypothetical protein